MQIKKSRSKVGEKSIPKQLKIQFQQEKKIKIRKQERKQVVT